MQDNLYQNIDQPIRSTLPDPEIQPQNIIPDPRRRLLIILSASIVALLLISLILSLFRSRPRPNPATPPTPIPTPTLTVVNQANVLPTAYQSQFKAIEDNLRFNPEILPPAVDVNLGL